MLLTSAIDWAIVLKFLNWSILIYKFQEDVGVLEKFLAKLGVWEMIQLPEIFGICGPIKSEAAAILEVLPDALSRPIILSGSVVMTFTKCKTVFHILICCHIASVNLQTLVEVSQSKDKEREITVELSIVPKCTVSLAFYVLGHLGDKT